MEVSLGEILQAREERAQLQHQLLQEFGCTVVSFTMNIAGPVKNTPLIQRGFREGLAALMSQLPKERIYKEYVDFAPAGCTAMLAVAMPASQVKEICVRLEENAPIGRLYDMDVLDADGCKLERMHERGCLVCGAPGRACAAQRLHTVPQLQAVTNRILREHFAVADREHIAALAEQSLIDEVNTTPKPGLVDRSNNGSHKDMTLEHFLISSRVLRPYFVECVRIGQETALLPPCETFPALRRAGLEAEKAMFQATGGVNTHKGIIYTMGIICGSIGRLWAPEEPISDIACILTESSKVVSESASADLQKATGSTAGEKCYLELGIGGIRKEVADGLPSVRSVSLPCYKELLAEGYSTNDAGAVTLLQLIARVADTNLYRRGGKDAMIWAADAAQKMLPRPSMADIAALDKAFIGRNLSPGGCADLLAVTYFLHALK